MERLVNVDSQVPDAVAEEWLRAGDGTDAAIYKAAGADKLLAEH